MTVVIVKISRVMPFNIVVLVDNCLHWYYLSMTVVIVKISHNSYFLLTCSAYIYVYICPGFSPGSARLF